MSRVESCRNLYGTLQNLVNTERTVNEFEVYTTIAMNIAWSLAVIADALTEAERGDGR